MINARKNLSIYIYYLKISWPYIILQVGYGYKNLKKNSIFLV